MLDFAVSEEKNRWLRQKIISLGVCEEDIEESFVRSSGNGGQHVNKTSSCVQLKHKITGITATCMRERSQSVNRFLARRELLERIEAASGVITPEMRRVEKLRKQKDRRRRRVTALTSHAALEKNASSIFVPCRDI
ncbi:MAG: peptide chain release factor-like protein [Deltaproteobacteria bacterium]|nr:peptide chain release factor-like protein [Deltaproteobacteria bacterium]